MELWMKTMLNREDQTGVDKNFIYFLLARSLFAQGKVNEAIKAYNLAHETDKNYLHPLFDLAYLYARKGDGDMAMETIRRLKEANRTARYPRTDQIEETEKDIEKLLHRSPDSPEKAKQKR
jgi:tetratricopeptide (TPR) repeat protein